MTMDAYIDIRLLPDPEFPATTLMNVLFSKLHRGLVQHGEGAIGVSFPDVKDGCRTLGNRLRLHGTIETLRSFQQRDWLVGMHDHTAASAPAAVPKNARHRIVRRVQAKSNPERERRRLMTRKGITTEQAMQAIPDSTAEKLHLPYLVLQSQSTFVRGAFDGSGSSGARNIWRLWFKLHGNDSMVLNPNFSMARLSHINQ
jgi:CRISPR-associated endonuclease Csy4